MLNRRESLQLLEAITGQNAINLAGTLYIPMTKTLALVASFSDPMPKITWDEKSSMYNLNWGANEAKAE